MPVPVLEILPNYAKTMPDFPNYAHNDVDSVQIGSQMRNNDTKL